MLARVACLVPLLALASCAELPAHVHLTREAPLLDASAAAVRCAIVMMQWCLLAVTSAEHAIVADSRSCAWCRPTPQRAFELWTQVYNKFYNNVSRTAATCNDELQILCSLFATPSVCSLP